MQPLTLIFLAQAGAVGPFLPEVHVDDSHTVVVVPCDPKSNSDGNDEIVVCVRRTDNAAQRLVRVQPLISQSSNVLHGGTSSLGEGVELSGGGPKGSTGAAIKLEF